MVKLTHLQADLVEFLKAQCTHEEIIRDFVKESYTVISPIYDLTLDTLIKALYIGYEKI